jgi:hypothetical protein
MVVLSNSTAKERRERLTVSPTAAAVKQGTNAQLKVGPPSSLFAYYMYEISHNSNPNPCSAPQNIIG